MAPSGLYARLCHAFFSYIFICIYLDLDDKFLPVEHYDADAAPTGVSRRRGVGPRRHGHRLRHSVACLPPRRTSCFTPSTHCLPPSSNTTALQQHIKTPASSKHHSTPLVHLCSLTRKICSRIDMQTHSIVPHYISTDSGVNSSSRFTSMSRTHRQTHKVKHSV